MTGAEFTQAVPQAVHGFLLSRCPCCGAPAEMWEHRNARGTFSKVVMCTRSGEENVGGLDGLTCPFLLPPSLVWHQPTYREAALFWNKASLAFRAQRLIEVRG